MHDQMCDTHVCQLCARGTHTLGCTRNSFTVWLSGCMYVHTCISEMCTCRCLYRYVTCRCAKNVHDAPIHSTVFVKQNAFFLHIRIRITKNAYSRTPTHIHTHLNSASGCADRAETALCQIRCSMLQHAVQHTATNCNTHYHCCLLPMSAASLLAASISAILCFVVCCSYIAVC